MNLLRTDETRSLKNAFPQQDGHIICVTCNASIFDTCSPYSFTCLIARHPSLIMQNGRDENVKNCQKKRLSHA